MKILITGFEPFGGEKLNPSYEAVKMLPDEIDGVQIVKGEIPVVFGRDFKVLEEMIVEEKPDVVICVGQAGGRSNISIEKVAVNVIDARIPDNDGNQPKNEAIYEDGADGYFAKLPVEKMVDAIKSHGIPAKISYTAGTYVCNDIMYRLLYFIGNSHPDIMGGFIHVPYIPEQVLKSNQEAPSMPVEMISEGIKIGLEALVSEIA